jgi:AraC family transcriptional regulator, regulatory protein of adaptative response / DNA-3-methyladenine glycosylase II
MNLDPDASYLAFVAKDARFDGKVFVGVTSTGIYCRPICRVRTPKRVNCRFFSSAALAEAALFRPCLKCRPEIAPSPQTTRWSVMDASRTLAEQAAALLDAELSEPQSAKLGALAARLGVSERHLRRIFFALWGVTPLQYLQTRRLLLAKALLTDSTLPVTQVALASGFGSVRRFNAAFADSYRMSPSRLRKLGVQAASVDASTFKMRLAYRAPYDMQGLGRFLTQRAIPGIEWVEWIEGPNTGRCNTLRIRRSLRGGALVAGRENLAASAPPPSGWLEVFFDEDRSQLHLSFSPHWVSHTAALVALVRRWLDLDASPHVIDTALHDLPGSAGQRLPGSLDGFELAVRAVLGQQVSVAAARTLASRLVQHLGSPLVTPWSEVSRCFFEPCVLAAQTTADLTALGLTQARARTLIALAQAWPQIEHELQAALFGQQPIEQLLGKLCELPGIGPWTAQYIAMRALSWPDARLPGDVALRKAMLRLFNTTTPRAVELRAQAWQPWRSYAALRLWNSLAN